MDFSGNEPPLDLIGREAKPTIAVIGADIRRPTCRGVDRQDLPSGFEL
jgi:hypothetical protein